MKFLERVRKSEDIVPWLNEEHGDSERTWAETVVNAPSVAYQFFERSHKVWFECSRQIRDNTVTSLMFFLVWDELDLAFKEAMEASYFSCVRCLRYVFEFAIEVAILEHKYSALPDGKEKFEKVFDDDDFKSFKRTVLARLQNEVHMVTEEEVTELDSIYVKLSRSGAHAIGESLKELPAATTAWHKFNPELLSLCNDLCRDVVDLMLVVLIGKYPILKSSIAETASRLGLAMTSSRMT